MTPLNDIQSIRDHGSRTQQAGPGERAPGPATAPTYNAPGADARTAARLSYAAEMPGTETLRKAARQLAHAADVLPGTVPDPAGSTRPSTAGGFSPAARA
jgi:hypothetical protein